MLFTYCLYITTYPAVVDIFTLLRQNISPPTKIAQEDNSALIYSLAGLGISPLIDNSLLPVVHSLSILRCLLNQQTYQSADNKHVFRDVFVKELKKHVRQNNDMSFTVKTAFQSEKKQCYVHFLCLKS